MSSLTKQAIIDCTIELASQKPINKITIHDIVNACGITRNTFYYYFHDIYDVLDQTVRQEVEKLNATAPVDYEKAVFDLIEFVVMYKKLWCSLYKSLGQEALSKYVIHWLHGIFVDYVRGCPDGDKVTALDLDIITAFYEEALFGVLSRWIRGDKSVTSDEMHDIINRLRVLFEGNVELVIQKAIGTPMGTEED